MCEHTILTGKSPFARKPHYYHSVSYLQKALPGFSVLTRNNSNAVNNSFLWPTTPVDLYVCKGLRHNDTHLYECKDTKFFPFGK